MGVIKKLGKAAKTFSRSTQGKHLGRTLRAAGKGVGKSIDRMIKDKLGAGPAKDIYKIAKRSAVGAISKRLKR